MVQISEAKRTIKEARLWIVGGQIIDAGYYKFNDNALSKKTYQKTD
ncbi:ATP-grasp domain-containing protein [Chryseobacterium luquanense]|uniref:ATP-grasp domain-containing protein n=1 Tax=Chryseobacterium luquanense TaxID=2983766 RepID=A0ABT3Y117_9FLAO|nr:ATP-grasp domain-containing protein [Chryseobacterium luquanense]MCX8531812.1 ATP-grasp domain-containing protein [Chryseobacterium luquanense]